MAGKIIQQSGSYRRGVVLGLTMAEVMLLLIFCFLLAVAALLRAEHEKMQTAEQEFRKEQAEFRKDQVELKGQRAEGTADRERSKSAKEEGKLSELLQSEGVDAGDPTAVKEFWRDLVEGRGTVAEARRSGLSEAQIKQALSKLAKLQAEGIKPEKALLDAESVAKAIGDKSLSSDQISEIVNRGLQKTSGHQWPPIINLSEAGGYFFKSGSAELSTQFRNELRESIPRRILELVRKYDVDIIEVVGHTDQQPIGSKQSNLDRDLLSVLKGSADIASVTPADNAGLGLARAVSVVSVLLQNPSLKQYRLLPLSGAQLIETNETLAASDLPVDIRERRRIEIRLRKFTPHDAPIRPPPVISLSDPKPQRQKPAHPPVAPSRPAQAVPWNFFRMQ
jgi:flagellar motor protein MotB